MISITGSAATIGNSWLAPGAAPVRAARSFQRAMRLRKDAMRRRLESFVLELAAAVVLIAIFAILADPATRGDR
jgi:hypothetical protein